MPIYRIGQNVIERVQETTFSAAGIFERADLQRLLREQIDVVAPNTHSRGWHQGGVGLKIAR